MLEKKEEGEEEEEEEEEVQHVGVCWLLPITDQRKGATIKEKSQ